MKPLPAFGASALVLLLGLYAPAMAQSPAAADGTPFVFGTVHTFGSKVLGEPRTLNVHLPDGYDTSTTARFPVVYVLDGSANEDFPHIAGLAQFMEMYGLLPRSIIVGIANTGRQHDFTPLSKVKEDMQEVPTAGGAAAFIDFLGKEVQPFIDAHYRTAKPRAIIGQSLGGLLATDILFHRPDLFDQYIIVSPSLWWDGGSLATEADAFVKAHAHMAKQVYFSLGTEGDEMQRYMDQVLAAFRMNAGPELKWTFAPFPEEDHATILHRSVYRAFEWLNAQ